MLLSTRPAQMKEWETELTRWRAELNIPFQLRVDPAEISPEDVDMLVLNPVAGIRDLAPYRGVKAVQSIWAGVEGLLANPTLPEEPVLCRMVEPGLSEGMTDYIVGHVLRHHLGIDRCVRESMAGNWAPAVPPLSRDRKVGVLGLGALGADAARMLARLRFDVAGWSRTAKSVDGVTCLHGAKGLDEILARSEILVTILPSTTETRGILNARTLALLPRGAVIINPGRGPLIDDDALLAALESGQIAHATLDVFNEEPLPASHPFWRNPQVTVTPHIAAETRASFAARVVVEQIGRMIRGEPLWHIVDRSLGY
ncbi:2-hydroxyacid dehydrogenase [Pikeienuella piscinae]|nr:glyoxylate/hydroxypyruvate reductase A [Pikeienuella piscinae]